MLTIDAKTVYIWFRKLVERTNKIIYNSNVIHVSEVSGCLRKSYYDRKSLRPTLDIKNVITTIGNGIHVLLQDLLREEGWKTEAKVEWDFKKFKLIGHIDLLKEDVILEIKTVSKVPDKPYIQNLRQINAYIIMAHARKGYIIYIGKNGYIRVFDVKPNKQLWHETVKRAFYLWHCLSRNEPPRPELSPLCGLCEYKWRCYR